MSGFVPLQRDCLALPPGEGAVPIMLYYGDLVQPTGRKPPYQPKRATPSPGLEVMVMVGDKIDGPFILLDCQPSRPLISRF